MAIRRPPGPEVVVNIGIDPDTLATLLEVRDRYGDIVALKQRGGELAYFINNPDVIRHILVRQHSRYAKGPGFERVKMLLGNGLIVSDGRDWRRSRRMIQPAISRQNVNRLVAVMVECCERLASRFAAACAADDVINITSATSEYALEVILISIFGEDYETKLLSDGVNPFAFLSNDSTRDLGVVLKARELRQLLLEIIDARRQGGHPKRFDFLSMYMQATDTEGNHFNDGELLDELITLIVAGFETSANTLSWCWLLLSRDASVEQRAFEESSRLLPAVSAASTDALAGMAYVQAVLDETLRLYPPVWLFTRRAREDDQLACYDMPTGTNIYLSPYILHRTERYWADPQRFDPDRFADNDAASKERAYFPFSLGPRRCIGEYFSMLEMKLHLGLLLPRFRLTALDDGDPGLDLAVNLRSASDILLRPEVRAA